MARLATLGFELQSTTPGVEYTSGSSSGLTISTSIVNGGLASMRVNPTSGFRWFGQVFSASLVGTATYVRTYIYIAAAPTVGVCEVIRMYASGAAAQRGGIELNADRTLTLRDQAGVAVASSSALTLNQWHRVELYAQQSTTSMTARVNGVQFALTVAATIGTYDAVYFGSPTTAASFDVYFDDIAINDTTGSSQISWPGAGKIKMLVPDGNTTNGWQNTTGGAGSSNNYTLVDETTPNDATDFVQTATSATDQYTMSASGLTSGDTVRVVHAGFRFANDIADPAKQFIFTVVHASSSDIQSPITPNSTTWKTNNVTTAFRYPYTSYFETGSTAWTNTTLDSLQIALGVSSTGTQKIRISKVWVMVDYDPLPVTFEQEGYRFRADDGSQSSASWLASQDSTIVRGAGINTRLRFIINATNNGAQTKNYRLEYRKVGDTDWTVIQ